MRRRPASCCRLELKNTGEAGPRGALVCCAAHHELEHDGPLPAGGLDDEPDGAGAEEPGEAPGGVGDAKEDAWRRRSGGASIGGVRGGRREGGGEKGARAVRGGRGGRARRRGGGRRLACSRRSPPGEGAAGRVRRSVPGAAFLRARPAPFLAPPVRRRAAPGAAGREGGAPARRRCRPSQR